MIVNVISSPVGGGAELLVRELHKILVGRKLDVYTIYLSGRGEGLGKNELFIGNNPRSPLNVIRIRAFLRKLLTKADGNLVVHAHLTWPFLYVALACLFLKNVKIVYTEHSTNNKRRNIPFFWIVERWVYQRYSKVICISQGVCEALSNWVGPEIAPRLVTIPNGSRIYSLTHRSSLKGRFPKLISVGSLSTRKNFATAIRAVAKMVDEVDTYTIVGEGPERKRLEEIIQRENLESKVRLVGWSEDIEAYLHDADIQLIPSIWEGFGLVAVEGMSTGLPVVASSVDGLREVLGELNPSVTLVNQAESVDGWVSAIRKAVADVQTCGASSLAGTSRRQAEKFTLDQMAERYLDVYRQL